MHNFKDYKFRCSMLGHLMSQPRNKKDILSVSTKAYLKDIYISEVYGRDYEILTKYMDKGNYAEEDSLTLLSENRKEIYFKNTKTLENECITGTPDLITDNSIIDIKTCWDMKTFMSKENIDKIYYWQLQGYMLLTGKKESELIYTLVSTPEHLIVQEKSKRLFQMGIDESSPEWSEEESRIERWMTFDDIDSKLRMRVFKIEQNENDIERIKERVQQAREYLSTLSLNNSLDI